MWYLYLDESGDWGFDFVHKKPSNLFTVTIHVVKGMENNRALINAIKKTIRRKLDPKRKRKSIDTELKGERTSIKVKEFFYKQLAGIPFEIFCMTMNKRRAFSKLADEKHRTYNYIVKVKAFLYRTSGNTNPFTFANSIVAANCKAIGLF